MVSNDNINELIGLVRKLQNTVNTLENHIGELDTKVEKLNYLSKLLDVTVNNITFGDILQYDSDGKWHNIQPDKVITGGSGSGSGIFKLKDLEDVEISLPVTGLSIVYSETDGKWHNDSVSGGGGGGLDPNVYLTKLDAKNTYFPLVGGTINGDVSVKGNLLTTGGITLYGKVI